MDDSPEPPETYQEFVRRFPKLAEAWRLAAEAGRDGPLDTPTLRLVKLAAAVGALREGAVHAGVRKALAERVPAAAVAQVLAAAGTIGFPVAVYSWVRDLLPEV